MMPSTFAFCWSSAKASEWDVVEALADGSLVRLLPAWKLPDADVVALTHQREGLPARTRNFMSFLQAHFRPCQGGGLKQFVGAKTHL